MTSIRLVKSRTTEEESWREGLKLQGLGSTSLNRKEKGFLGRNESLVLAKCGGGYGKTPSGMIRSSAWLAAP
jgi:hypothetical protein